ncbi:MAG: DUF3127 domain-containing protein [Saprospiraceae bacterium]|nr:DUF3127 domain-containing protein [Saprospiraceae bacterium]
MSELSLTGKVYKIFETTKISDSFEKRDFVIETEDQYPQKVKFELTQSKCSLIDDLKEGENITVHFNIRGREWENTQKGEMVYFVSLNAWRIEKGQTNTLETDVPFPTADTVVPAETDSAADDLPF